jgi:periplasmic divalent cation tolerance protein
MRAASKKPLIMIKDCWREVKNVFLGNAMKTEKIVCFVTAPPDKSAFLAKTFVEKRLAACVNIVSPITSIYFWQGKVCEDAEHLLVIKTTRAKLKELKEAVTKLHPYETPELIALKIEDGLEKYLAWIEETTNRK